MSRKRSSSEDVEDLESRLHHSKQERKRRRLIQTSIDTLRGVVPELNDPRKIPRRIVLDKTVDYIIELQHKLKDGAVDDCVEADDPMEAAVLQSLVAENARLREQIRWYGLLKSGSANPDTDQYRLQLMGPAVPGLSSHLSPSSNASSPQVVPFTPPMSMAPAKRPDGAYGQLAAAAAAVLHGYCASQAPDAAESPKVSTPPSHTLRVSATFPMPALGAAPVATVDVPCETGSVAATSVDIADTSAVVPLEAAQAAMAQLLAATSLADFSRVAGAAYPQLQGTAGLQWAAHQSAFAPLRSAAGV